MRLALEGDVAVGLVGIHSCSNIVQKLERIRRVEPEDPEFVDLPHMLELVPQQTVEILLTELDADVDPAAERDGDRPGHEERPQPPGISEADARAGIRKCLFELVGQFHRYNRRMQKALVAAAVLALASSALAQQDFSKVEVKATKVAGTVYMLTGSGGNIGVSAGDDGMVIVDDEFAPLASKIIQALNGISDKPIKFVLNTHYHGDHTGGNEIFAREAPIIAHENARKRLQSGAKAFGREFPPSPKIALPVVTFNDRLTIHVNGEDIRAIHAPSGHTDGDVVVYFTKSNVVHMGDDFFNGGFPIIDVENGGSVRGMIAAVEKVIASIPDDAKVIPGHGALGDKASLRAFAEMLKATSTALEKEIRSGKTAAQLKEAKVLAPWDATWGQAYVKADFYIDELYAEFGKK
jgi:cyclase